MIDSTEPGDARQARISEEAAEWLLLLEDGEIDAAGRAALTQWLKVSPEHVAAMLSMKRLFDRLKREAQVVPL